jgi:hypothetical protein
MHGTAPRPGHHVNVRGQIIKALEQFPALTTEELSDLTLVRLSGVQKRIKLMLTSGEIERISDGRRRAYKLKVREPENEVCTDAPFTRKSELRSSTTPPNSWPVTAVVADPGKIISSALQAELFALRAWKDAEIKRFPDLAVPETTMRARKIVAAQLLSDPHQREKVLSGRADTSVAMRATIAALEEA